MNKNTFHSFMYKAGSWKHQQRVVGTELECCTVTTMRERLLLSAVSIDEKNTCIRLRFSQKVPMLPEMMSVFLLPILIFPGCAFVMSCLQTKLHDKPL